MKSYLLSSLMLALLLLLGAAAIAQTSSTTSSTTSTTGKPTEFPFVNTLMPQPASLSVATTRFELGSGFSVGLSHFRDDRLRAATLRMVRRLEDQTGLQIPHEFLPEAQHNGLVLDVAGAGSKIPSLEDDESYSLAVDANGARLHAATVAGALRGMETLLQLVATDGHGFYLPAVTITDVPRFRWRGLMIDCGRHFEPLSVLERTLDAMAAVKLNVFHWHLAEDQGFRIESRAFPKLTGMGSDGLFYTQDQARELVAYAAARGIRVVPEFDMPGHTTSWFVGYPELASGPGPYSVQRVFGIHDPAMDPTRDSTYKFIDTFVGEMAAIFPDAYMHIGGDESNGKQWEANPRIQEFMKAHKLADSAVLQAYFNTRLLAILKKHGKRMVGWDEVLNPGLPKDVVVQSWRGVEALDAGAKQGYSGILSAPYYLDAMKSAEQHYLADPIPATSTLTPEQRKLILGGEVCMWAEHLNEFSIDSRIWPRTAAIAERFWSPASVTDLNDMYRRLDVESLRLESLGLTHRTHEEAALRELARSSEGEALPDARMHALHVFASAVEPVSFPDRYKGQHTSQLTPLDRLVDAVRPDPPSRHAMDVLVKQFLAGPGNHADIERELRATFLSWIEAAPRVEQSMTHSPLLAEGDQRAHQLGELGLLGLEALSYIEQGAPIPADWKQQKVAILDEAAKPSALVRFTMLAPLRALVDAAPASATEPAAAPAAASEP